MLVDFFSFDVPVNFLFWNQIHVSSELKREREVLVRQGDPRANQYSSHLLHNIKSMLASRGQRHPNTQPTNAYGAIHTHVNTINHTHAFKNLHWNKLQPLQQAAPTAVSWLQQPAGWRGGWGEVGRGQRASNRWLKSDKRLGDVTTWLQVNQQGAIWAPFPDSR